MLSLLFVILIPTPSSILFRCMLYVPGCKLRTIETRVGTLVSVSVSVVRNTREVGLAHNLGKDRVRKDRQ